MSVNYRHLQIIGRDVMVFESICEFMLDHGGNSPMVSDLVCLLDAKLGLPNGKQKSTSNSTVSKSLVRLDGMGLISLRRERKSGIRSAGSITVKGSTFTIEIGPNVAQEVISKFHEERRRFKRNSSK